MIFISHKDVPDHETAFRIAQMLRSNGVTCWIAPESVPEGRFHAEEITKAINTCEIFLLILTPETRKSEYVRMELNFAIDHKKKIIPLMLGDFDLDDVYKYLLGTRQIMKFDFSEPACWDLVEKCKTGERVVNMEIGKNPARSVVLIKGGFSENLDYIIREMPDDLDRTVFAMGIDCTSDVTLSSTVGILKSVMDYLKEEFDVSAETLQDLIDRAKIEQLHHSERSRNMQYRDSVLIRVPIEPGTPGRSRFLQLLLIANSRKTEDWNGDVDKVVGIDSREIILEVFRKCEEIGEAASHLVIGAMGTNGTGYPYEVVTAEILNCFVYAKRRSEDMKKISYPLHLWYSVRQEDMEKWGLTSDEVLSYISMVVSFFKDD